MMEAKEKGGGFCGNRRNFAQRQRYRQRKKYISKLREDR